MWVTYSNKGTKIQKDFWDWCCMYKIMTDYMEADNLTEDEAYTKFWEDVKNYDPDGFMEMFKDKTIVEAMADSKLWDNAFQNGWMDETRAEYLQALNIDCVKVTGFNIIGFED